MKWAIPETVDGQIQMDSFFCIMLDQILIQEFRVTTGDTQRKNEDNIKFMC